jgi:hypothetical protein
VSIQRGVQEEICRYCQAEVNGLFSFFLSFFLLCCLPERKFGRTFQGENIGEKKKKKEKKKKNNPFTSA